MNDPTESSPRLRWPAWVILLFGLYVGTYIALRIPATARAQAHHLSWITYLNISTEVEGETLKPILIILHYIFWPLNQLDRRMCNGLPHSTQLPIFRFY